MAMEIRRVVTGHDENGKAVVSIDEVTTNVISRRQNQSSTVVWATKGGLPPSLDGDEDISHDIDTTIFPGGTVFRIGKLDPGVAPRVHRTASIDYAIVISGELDMELDDGVTVHLKPGDCVVQRGTVHNWVNNGTEPVIIAFILIDAKMPADWDAFG
jgi:mannose-6-phosphate isomerase-like protein (cupin superfamily)